MLEKIVGGSVLAGSLLLCSGCVSFKEYDVSKIENVVPVVRHAEAELKDFGDLSWDEVIEFVETPEQAREYCQEMRRVKGYSSGLFLESFKSAHEGFSVDCSEGAYAAAALLSDNGYPPLVLFLRTEMSSGRAHAVFLYKKKGKFGSIGLLECDSLLPKYDSVNDLAQGIAKSMLAVYEASPVLQSFYGEAIVFRYYSVSNLMECDVDFVKRKTPRLSIVTCENEIKYAE